MLTGAGDGKSNGLILGRYHILAKLGHGGMGDVFLAAAEGFAGFSKLVVIKRLRNMDDPQHIAMFLNEARIARQLNHPNIVQTYEIGHEEGSHLLVMEYLHGPTLAHLRKTVKGGPLPWAVEVEILRQVLEGLHYAHELCAIDGRALHLVHRDLSPENVIVTDRGECKILDFGIAKAVDSIVQTQAGFFKGKLKNMPPEQFRGEQVDRRADIFAAGVLLWEGLSGNALWGDRSSAAIAVQLAQGEIPSLQKLDPLVPVELRELCEQALRPTPERRFETALAMRAALSSYVDARGGPLGRQQLGGFVEPLFAEERARIDRIIRSQTAKNVRFSTALSAAPLAESPSAAASEATFLETQPLGRTAGRGRRIGWSVAALVVLFAAGGAAWMQFFAPMAGSEAVPSGDSPGANAMPTKSTAPPQSTTPPRSTAPPKSTAPPESAALPKNAGKSAGADAPAPQRSASRTLGGGKRVKGKRGRPHAGERGRPARRRRLPPHRVAFAAPNRLDERASPSPPSEKDVAALPPVDRPSPAPAAEKPAPAPASRGEPSATQDEGDVRIPAPALPRIYLARSVEDLVAMCDRVEAAVTKQAGVAASFARGTTRPMRQLLGSQATIYPAGMYWFIVREAGLRHDRSRAAEALSDAHRRGVLERFSEQLPAR